jgi:hypothetical protein
MKKYSILVEALQRGQFNIIEYFLTIESDDLRDLYNQILKLKPFKLILDQEYKVKCSGNEFLFSDLVVIVLGAKEASKQFGYDEQRAERKLSRMKLKTHNL